MGKMEEEGDQAAKGGEKSYLPNLLEITPIQHGFLMSQATVSCYYSFHLSPSSLIRTHFLHPVPHFKTTFLSSLNE
jgi:hypothetical protein